MRYLSIQGNMVEKRKKLSIQKPTFFIDNEARRMVENPTDPMSPIKIYKTIRNLCHPTQEYVFCAPANKKLTKEFKSCDLNYKFDGGKRLGINTIGDFCKHIRNRCELEDFVDAKSGNHAWRAWMITKLSNDDSVNDRSLMSYSRHTNPVSAIPYKRKSENSDAKFQKAIQPVKLPSQRTIRRHKQAEKNAQKKDPEKVPVQKPKKMIKSSIRTRQQKKEAESKKK